MSCRQPNSVGALKEKEDFTDTYGPLRGSQSPSGGLSRRGLNPIKLVYDPDQPDGRLYLTVGHL